MMYGWALTVQGQEGEGMAQMHHGLTAWRAMGIEAGLPYWLAMLAEAYGSTGQVEAGRGVLAEALTLVDTTEERWWEAELHRLKGELLLALSTDNAAQAETCFHQALDIARRQQAMSLELRAAMSVSRLWQHQGKRARPTSCWWRYMAGSLRASTRRTCKKPEHCWPSCAQRRSPHRQHDSPAFLHWAYATPEAW
jgi:predicted ATPase